MNPSSAPRQTGRLHTFVRTLSLLLLQPALAPGVTQIQARSRLPSRCDAHGFLIQEAASMPYLSVVGAVPLRFGAEPPPPDLTTKPAAGAPPVPLSVPANTIAPEARPVAPLPPEAPPAVAPAPSAAPAPAKANDTNMIILPDDTSPPAPRAEDFLPFFQYPGGGNSPAAAARPPGPGTLPPSSATYQQK